MAYSIDFISLNQQSSQLRIYAKFGDLGAAWVHTEIPKLFYDAIMQLAESEVKAHEAKMKMALLAEKAGEE
jgi:hypothetical protein